MNHLLSFHLSASFPAAARCLLARSMQGSGRKSCDARVDKICAGAENFSSLLDKAYGSRFLFLLFASFQHITRANKEKKRIQTHKLYSVSQRYNPSLCFDFGTRRREAFLVAKRESFSFTRSAAKNFILNRKLCEEGKVVVDKVFCFRRIAKLSLFCFVSHFKSKYVSIVISKWILCIAFLLLMEVEPERARYAGAA